MWIQCWLWRWECPNVHMKLWALKLYVSVLGTPKGPRNFTLARPEGNTTCFFNGQSKSINQTAYKYQSMCHQVIFRLICWILNFNDNYTLISSWHFQENNKWQYLQDGESMHFYLHLKKRLTKPCKAIRNI